MRCQAESKITLSPGASNTIGMPMINAEIKGNECELKDLKEAVGVLKFSFNSGGG